MFDTRGAIMTKGRSRPFKSGVTRQDCHCNEMECTTKNGIVPIADCRLQCIDTLTGIRYGLDEHDNCLCPICGCLCNLSWDVSIYDTVYLIAFCTMF